MIFEIPNRESVEEEITRINSELLGIEKDAQVEGQQKFIPSANDYQGVSIPDTTQVEGFWKHYAGGAVVSMGVEYNFLEATGQYNIEEIRDSQHKAFILATTWRTHPNSIQDRINLESTTAFLAGGFAFDWTKSPTLAKRLLGLVSDLGDQYMLRNGRIPLGYTPR
jgi:hypothetical protein